MGASYGVLEQPKGVWREFRKRLGGVLEDLGASGRGLGNIWEESRERLGWSSWHPGIVWEGLGVSRGGLLGSRERFGSILMIFKVFGLNLLYIFNVPYETDSQNI